MVSFFVLERELISIKLPEWQPATNISFLRLPVDEMQVIVSVMIWDSIFKEEADQNFNVQSSLTVTNSF